MFYLRCKNFKSKDGKYKNIDFNLLKKIGNLFNILADVLDDNLELFYGITMFLIFICLFGLFFTK